MGHVLVIDDQEPVTEFLQEALTSFGHEVKTATDGGEGMSLFEKERFDLVITDMRMPKMDGHAVVRHIRRSENPHIPIIGISGTPWLFEKDTIDMVLGKPFTLQTLSWALSQVRHTPRTAGDADLPAQAG